MNKKAAFSLFAVLVLVLAVSFIARVSSAQNVGVSKISSSVYASIKDNGSAKVLITLPNESAKTTSSKFSLLAASQVQNNSQTEESIIKELGNKVSYSGDGMIYATVNSSQLQNLETLASRGAIRSVAPERIFHIDAETPTTLVNVTNVQKIVFNSENLTGKGETICIIDTGVDYNHPDLGGCYGNNNASSPCKVLGGYNFINNTSNPMDDNGHGTHVAGIIAASGNLTGVAPGAKIIAIKVCDASGSCSEANIQKGFNWCVNNASKFNISVISMSIGTSAPYLYSGYCNSDPLVSAVSSAVAKNISVVASSGNDGNSTAMSSPACIQNVISVGDTYVQNYSQTFNWGPGVCTDVNPRENQIVCHSNRDSALDLLAPGAMINSTVYPGAPVCSEGNCSGYYGELGGTSMAAPHVSAAIAILDQYLHSVNRTMTPSQLKSALNSTGKKIHDSATGLNFSGININAALFYIDSSPPSVSLNSPPNGTISSNENQTFSCSATDLSLKNSTLEIWNSTSLYYNATQNLTGYRNSTSFNATLVNGENYEWNCLYSDSNGNLGYSTQNSTLRISPGFIILNPANNTFTKSNATFSCNSTYLLQNETLSNVTLSVFNFTGNKVYNKTENISGNSNLTYFNYNFTNQSEYLWSCSFNTNASSIVSSENRTITYDLTPPSVNSTSPANGTTYSEGTKTVRFSYDSADNFEMKNCSLNLNGSNVLTNSSISQKANAFSRSMPLGTYFWKIVCFDKAGNFNSSAARVLRIDAVPPSSGSAAPPAVSNSPVAAAPAENITQGYSVLIPEYSMKFFELSNSERHTIIVNGLSNSYANLTVESSPINFRLEVGQGISLNLSSPDYYDLYVELNSIRNGKANITIKELTTDNRIFHIQAAAPANVTNSSASNQEPNAGGKLIWTRTSNLVFAGLIVLVILVSFFLEIKQNKPEN